MPLKEGRECSKLDTRADRDLGIAVLRKWDGLNGSAGSDQFPGGVLLDFSRTIFIRDLLLATASISFSYVLYPLSEIFR